MNEYSAMFPFVSMITSFLPNNIFAFAMIIPLIFILPRMTDSLHPGNGGNPGFNVYDMNDQLRIVFRAGSN